MTIPVKKQQSGFTLLELVVVVAVLGLIANLATEFVAQNTNQERFEATKARQAMIREAILGNPSATQNGEVQVSGYIADTGSPPRHLRQLISSDAYCPNPESFDSDKTTCNTDAAGDSDLEWIDSPAGWSGPYIQGFELESTTYNSNPINFRTFRDGWGNTSSAWDLTSTTDNERIADDVLNFGWSYYVGENTSEGTGVDEGKNENLNDIFVISAGLDGDMDPGSDSTEDRTGVSADFDTSYAALNVYERDFPRTEYSQTDLTNPDPEYDLKHSTLISANEYNADAIARIENTTGSTVYICVVAWNEDISLEKKSSSLEILSGSTLTHSVQIPHGQYYVDIQAEPDADANRSTEECDTLSSVSSGTSLCTHGSEPAIVSTRTSQALNCEI